MRRSQQRNLDAPIMKPQILLRNYSMKVRSSLPFVDLFDDTKCIIVFAGHGVDRDFTIFELANGLKLNSTSCRWISLHNVIMTWT